MHGTTEVWARCWYGSERENNCKNKGVDCMVNVAKTPPMGWNSWDCYGASVTESDILGNANYMAKHLKEFGWEYVVCDI